MQRHDSLTSTQINDSLTFTLVLINFSLFKLWQWRAELNQTFLECSKFLIVWVVSLHIKFWSPPFYWYSNCSGVILHKSGMYFLRSKPKDSTQPNTLPLVLSSLCAYYIHFRWKPQLHFCVCGHIKCTA